jgi:hypothetical protein
MGNYLRRTGPGTIRPFRYSRDHQRGQQPCGGLYTASEGKEQMGEVNQSRMTEIRNVGPVPENEYLQAQWDAT